MNHLFQQAFGRVVCINLRSCTERWDRFRASIERAGMPISCVVRFDAIDGSRCTPPDWWGAGRGAWGCHQSHVRILEDALQDGVESLLILEDDALFCDDFSEKFSRFWSEVSKNWDGLLLGGQHLKPPRVVTENVLRVMNGNRTHAHALRGRYIVEAYRHLCDYPTHANVPDRHVDHRLGALHESGEFNVYAPRHWLVGQCSGFSSIRRQVVPERFWNGWTSEANVSEDGRDSNDTVGASPVVILGPYRSGTSCVAGILHQLGFHLGSRLAAGNRNNERGYFEPLWLSQQLRQLCDEPRLAEPAPREFTINVLRQWLRQESKIAHDAGKQLAVKHPLLCLLGNEILKAWGQQTRFISVVRPLEESAESLDRTGWWRAPYRQFVLKSLWDARQTFLADHEHLEIHYSCLLDNPRTEITRIIQFLGLAFSELQIEEAVRFVHRP